MKSWFISFKFAGESMSFSIDIAKFAKKANKTAGEAARGIKLELLNSIIRDTHVITGRLRGNWQTTTGSPTYTETDRLDKTPQGVNGGVSQDEVQATVESNTLDYMTNNLPYAAIREEKDGMVSKNIARFNRTAREIAKDVSN